MNVDWKRARSIFNTIHYYLLEAQANLLVFEVIRQQVRLSQPMVHLL